MTFSGDPYRTLGLAPGASLDEVKRAYRRLAKQYHPDAAGPAAVTRFLAIQGAYEILAAPGQRGRMPGRSAGRPSEADPDRARATREAYRAGRGGGWGSRSGQGPGTAEDPWRDGSRRTAGPRPAGGAGASGGARAGSGTSGSGTSRASTSGSDTSGSRSERADARGSGASGPGSRGPGGARPASAGMSSGSSSEGSSAGTSGASRTRSRARASGDRGPDRRPSRRKATLSSTSYDEAAQEPRHPEWQGSSWYGTSSGTYWTINPREYADPRKHGPEYQARARRAGAGAGSPEAEETAPGGTASAGGFATSGTWEGWTATGEAARAPSMAEPRGGSPGDSSGAEEVGRGVPTAGSIGLLAGALAAIPAATVALASIMSGDPSVVPVAIGLPALVGVGVGVAVALARRARSG